jgi:hypothetical protein
MSNTVTQTPRRHFNWALLESPSVYMLNIQVLKRESSIIKKMHREVVMGDRALVSAILRFLNT